MNSNSATQQANQTCVPSEINKNSSYWSDTVRLISGTVAAQLIIVASTPILSRIYEPEAFGDSALFLSLILILGTVACFRYELAIVLPEKKSAAANLLASCVLITTIQALLAIPVVYFFVPQFLEAFDRTELLNYLWIVPLALWVNGLFIGLSYWQTRHKNYFELSLTKVVNSAVYALSATMFGLLGYTSGASKKGSFNFGAIGRDIAFTCKHTLLRHVFSSGKIRWSSMVFEFRTYRKFPLIDSWLALINAVSANRQS